MWCLAIHLPLVIGDWIPSDNAKWLLFLKLLEITSICLASEVSEEQIAYLQVLIEDHHNEFCHLYSHCSITSKMHFMIHMPRIIMRFVQQLVNIMQCGIICVVYHNGTGFFSHSSWFVFVYKQKTSIF